jgi:hypothetical protein
LTGPRHSLRIPPALSGGGYGGARLFWLPDQAPTSRMGYSGAPQTIAVMRKAVLEDASHFDTRQLAESVCEGLDSKDYTSEYTALYHFLLQRTRYMRDPRRVELVRAPYLVSRQIMAGRRPSLDCDDMATWLAAAVLAVGGRAEFMTVAFAKMFFEGQQQYSHVFTRALEPRTRCQIVLDPVAAEKTPEMLRRIKAAAAWPIAA